MKFWQLRSSTLQNCLSSPCHFNFELYIRYLQSTKKLRGNLKLGNLQSNWTLGPPNELFFFTSLGFCFVLFSSNFHWPLALHWSNKMATRIWLGELSTKRQSARGEGCKTVGMVSTQWILSAELNVARSSTNIEMIWFNVYSCFRKSFSEMQIRISFNSFEIQCQNYPRLPAYFFVCFIMFKTFYLV